MVVMSSGVFGWRIKGYLDVARLGIYHPPLLPFVSDDIGGGER